MRLYPWIVALLAVIVCSCATQSRTAMTSKERLVQIFEEKASVDPSYLFDGYSIPEEDQRRAITCAIRAIVYDIPESDASRLVDMLGKKIPPEKDFIVKWVAPKTKENPDRVAQRDQRVREICPDIADELLKRG